MQGSAAVVTLDRDTPGLDKVFSTQKTSTSLVGVNCNVHHRPSINFQTEAMWTVSSAETLHFKLYLKQPNKLKY